MLASMEASKKTVTYYHQVHFEDAHKWQKYQGMGRQNHGERDFINSPDIQEIREWMQAKGLTTLHSISRRENRNWHV